MGGKFVVGESLGYASHYRIQIGELNCSNTSKGEHTNLFPKKPLDLPVEHVVQPFISNRLIRDDLYSPFSLPYQPMIWKWIEFGLRRRVLSREQHSRHIHTFWETKASWIRMRGSGAEECNVSLLVRLFGDPIVNGTGHGDVTWVKWRSEDDGSILGDSARRFEGPGGRRRGNVFDLLKRLDSTWED